MAITLSCPCGRKLQVGDEHAGQKGRCPACGWILDIPNPQQSLEWPGPLVLEPDAPRSSVPPLALDSDKQDVPVPPSRPPLTLPRSADRAPPPRSNRRILGGALIIIIGLVVAALRFGPLFFRGQDDRVAVTDKEEVYYKNVSRDDANQLGQVLMDLKWFDGNTPKTVQLSRRDNCYIISFVVQDGIWNNADAVEGLRLLGLQLSARLYEGQPIEVRLCDQHLKVMKTLRLDKDTLGKRLEYSPREEIFYKEVTEEDARKLGDVLKQLGRFDGEHDQTLLVARDAEGVKISFVVGEGVWNDDEVVQDAKNLGRLIRLQVFQDWPLEIRLTNERLALKKKIPIP